MPHIVSQTEPAAWYALGYEQARDALLFIQYACKAAKGELSWVRGPDFGALENDLAVKISNSYGRLATLSYQGRKALFAPANPGIQANFYDNCVAFAAGADAYRRAVQNSLPGSGTPEAALRAWLDSTVLPETSHTLAWVFQDPIQGLDIAAQGAWTAAVTSFRWPKLLPNAKGASYVGRLAAPGANGEFELEPEPYDPFEQGSVDPWLEEFRQHTSKLPGAPSAFSGSATFAWSRLFCRDPAPGTTEYSGLLGDPYQPIPSYHPQFHEGFFSATNHLWFAHVKVTPAGASVPTLDILGHVPHASASFFTSHNRNVAMGGTLASPNTSDTFLLRLREASVTPPTGLPADSPHEYYSYYHDSTQSNLTWKELVEVTVQLRLGRAFHYWRAGSFGVVLPDRSELLAYLAPNSTTDMPGVPVVYGERTGPNQYPPWRVGIRVPGNRPKFWKTPEFALVNGSSQLITSPMVVTLRAPIDPAVSGDDMHWQLLRDIWEISHASTVFDVASRTNGGAYPANVCFVDRNGALFSTQMSAIPERGNDTALMTNPHYQYRTLDKWRIYSKSAGPVPARHYDDRMFDWRFDNLNDPDHPAQLRYLQYPTTTPPGTAPFKPRALQAPLIPSAIPPTSYAASGPFWIESGYFASASNDMIWGFSRKRDIVKDDPGSAAPFNNAFVYNQWTLPNPEPSPLPPPQGNQLFQWVLDAGVAYQSSGLGFEAPAHQLTVVDQFTRQAERFYRGGTAGLPPLTPVQMREFVCSPRLYSEEAYVHPSHIPSNPPVVPIVFNPTLPAAIRQLKEVVDNPTHDPTRDQNPLVAAAKDLHFFSDLWTKLFSQDYQHLVDGSPSSEILRLRDLWVNASVTSHPNQIFWYSDPVNSAGLQWIDLPPNYPLIDFYWRDSEVSDGVTAGDLASSQDGLLANESGRLSSLVSALVSWDPAGAHYRSVPTSPGACLLHMMQMRYNAATVSATLDFGRHWVPLIRGQVPTTTGGLVQLLADGQAPATATLLRLGFPWSALRNLAFPSGQYGTLFHNTKTPITPPYDALYIDPVQRSIRPVLRPRDTNELVQFFLSLGGFYIDPLHNGGNPSTKLAKYNLNGGLAYPLTYPLTDGLQRLTVPRALLDTGAYLDPTSSAGIPPLSDHFRARAYAQQGQLWPAIPVNETVSDDDCVGAGGLRAVSWHEDKIDLGWVEGRGFQPKFLGAGGSIAKLVAMFPSSGSGVDSHFWCTPGIEIMGSNPARFNAHMNAFATNDPLETYYDTFLNHIVSQVVHFY